jgi:hypothetical protein
VCFYASEDTPAAVKEDQRWQRAFNDLAREIHRERYATCPTLCGGEILHDGTRAVRALEG